jgi:membrane peptidoglycan carboxypeptidase
MNSYGHPQPSGHADEAGYDVYDSYSEYQDTYAADSYGSDPYPADAYRGGRSGRASAAVAAAPAGRARVAPPDEAARPRYDWSGGGRGVATVPVSPAGGPVTGRATVRPVGPGGPGGPAVPAGTGPGDGRPAKKKKRHWIRNTFLILLAITVISVGGGMVALSYYVDSVPQPEALDLAEASTIYFADGSEVATLSELNREIIDTTVPELANARNAMVAAEDKNFYDHSGVDFMGIVRAAWGNATGGTRSGASTIDQQYTRAAAGLTEDSYGRKLQEAAMAYKLNQEFDKEEILDFYLNTIYLGRGAYGIQAAADAYFNKEAKDLTAGEAALIAGVVRLPDDGTGLSPYDPLHESENTQVPLERWNYVLDQMVDIDALAAAERAELTELPEVEEPPSADEPLKGRYGTIVKQVQYELEAMGITDAATGGYRVTTTIDKDIQKAALEAARRKNKASYWDGMPKNVKSSIVAINPEDGAVLAYYGGTDNGTGIDLAGPNRDDETGEWSGGFPPGSSAKIYTLMAALRQGVSFQTKWKTTPFTPEWRETPINNAGRGAATDCEGGQAPDNCPLSWATQFSFNTPFIYLSAAVPDSQGPAKIIEAARDAGVKRLVGTSYDDEGNPVDEVVELSELAPEDVTNYFFHEVAIGQYPITALDHANGVATLAARGVYNEAHFVEKVEKRDDSGEWVEVEGSRIAGEQRIQAEHADAITDVLTAVPGLNSVPLEGGRVAAAKTGTWEHLDPDGNIDGNGDAWVVGYTPQIATAVWVGDPKRGAIVDGNGNQIGSSGLPAFIWKQFMDAAHAAKEYSPEQFTPAQPVGNPLHEYANGVEPEPDRNNNCDRFPFPLPGCDDDDDDDDDDRGNNNGGGGILPPPPDGDQDQDGG